MSLLNLRARLLQLLENRGSDYTSGAALAQELGVSRNAVWKAVEALRSEGYSIAAVTNKGYRVEGSGDMLSADGIYAFLKTKGIFSVQVKKSVTSTNTLLRGLAAEGAPEGYVLAAEEQTAGKGRLGRAFHSPAGHGIYFSVLLRPGSKTDVAPLITSAAAVAAARAVEEVLGVSVGIKWVNDLFVGEKKVCGILTEAAFDMESGLIESAVLGIGINITRPDEGFPGELRDVATSLTDRDVGMDSQRVRLIAAVLDNFWLFYQDLGKREFLDEYRARSIVLGRSVNVISYEGSKVARVIEIDDDCGLVVELADGEQTTLSSGDVSIRL